MDLFSCLLVALPACVASQVGGLLPPGDNLTSLPMGCPRYLSCTASPAPSLSLLHIHSHSGHFSHVSRISEIHHWVSLSQLLFSFESELHSDFSGDDKVEATGKDSQSPLYPTSPDPHEFLFSIGVSLANVCCGHCFSLRPRPILGAL